MPNLNNDRCVSRSVKPYLYQWYPGRVEISAERFGDIYSQVRPELRIGENNLVPAGCRPSEDFRSESRLGCRWVGGCEVT